MSRSKREITELDLLAYADGFLDHDPVRRQQVEDYLADRPDEAERLRAYAIQNREIRSEYAYMVAEPVPQALREVLEKPDVRSRSLGIRAAAVAALMVGSAAVGWIASEAAQAPDEIAAFVSRAAAGYRAAASAAGPVPAAQSSHVGWLSEQVAVNIDVPDLGTLGLTPVNRQRLQSVGGHSTVRIEYAGAGDKRLVLVVGTRWPERVPEVHLAEESGLAIAHWHDGPLMYGLVAEAGDVPVAELARSIAQRQDRTIKAVPKKPEAMRAVDIQAPPAASTGEPRLPHLPSAGEEKSSVN